MNPILPVVVKSALFCSFMALFSSCVATSSGYGRANNVPHGNHKVVVGVREQQLALLDNGRIERVYSISTSKYGLGNRPNSYATPLGKMAIADKIGDGAPPGAVFKGRRFTGEIVRANTGRDPIITRVMPLMGLEPQNANTARRAIYIHGTPAENQIGRPVSYGCVRMRSMDVVDLYNRVQRGTPVVITNYPWMALLAQRRL